MKFKKFFISCLLFSPVFLISSAYALSSNDTCPSVETIKKYCSEGENCQFTTNSNGKEVKWISSWGGEYNKKATKLQYVNIFWKDKEHHLQMLRCGYDSAMILLFSPEDYPNFSVANPIEWQDNSNKTGQGCEKNQLSNDDQCSFKLDKGNPNQSLK